MGKPVPGMTLSCVMENTDHYGVDAYKVGVGRRWRRSPFIRGRYGKEQEVALFVIRDFFFRALPDLAQ